MFSIKWDHVCYECGCPMSIRMVINESIEKLPTFLNQIGSWNYLKPFKLFNNTWFYKFYGGIPCKRVCVSCYYEPKRANLLSRETGIKKLVQPRIERCKTHQEIFEYYTSFLEFLKRRDLASCLVPRWKQKDISGMRMFCILQ